MLRCKFGFDTAEKSAQILIRSPRWPSYPWEEHLIKVEEFDLLESQIETILSDACKDLGCRETMTGNGQDYLGCQYQTNSGYMCQNWLEQSPQSHSYIPEWYPDGHLGDHNFCRNPDGDSTIWCAFALRLAVCFASKIWICAERTCNHLP